MTSAVIQCFCFSLIRPHAVAVNADMGSIVRVHMHGIFVGYLVQRESNIIFACNFKKMLASFAAVAICEAICFMAYTGTRFQSHGSHI